MSSSEIDRSVPQAGQSWLEKHFEVNRTMYEAALRAVGIPRGARVLDAGCGPGSYLPWIADLVGPDGSITAIDCDADHVAVAGRMASRLPCTLSARVGSVAELPFAAGEFDVVWLANTSVYFADDELAAVLAGLRRVVRSGGIIAIKDPDADLYRVRPLDPAIFAHYWETCARGGDKPFAKLVRGILRAGELRRVLEHAGLIDVRQRSFMQELWAPLRPVEREWVMEFLTYYRDTAEEFGVPAADLAFWRTMTPAGYASPDHIINHPDFYYREGNTLAVGVVP